MQLKQYIRSDLFKRFSFIVKYDQFCRDSLQHLQMSNTLYPSESRLQNQRNNGTLHKYQLALTKQT